VAVRLGRRDREWNLRYIGQEFDQRCRALSLRGASLPDRKPDTIVTGCPSKAGEVFCQERGAARISEGVAPSAGETCVLK